VFCEVASFLAMTRERCCVLPCFIGALKNEMLACSAFKVDFWGGVGMFFYKLSLLAIRSER